MFFIAYAFKGQVHVFAGGMKIVNHSSCRTSAILKYFFPDTAFDPISTVYIPLKNNYIPSFENREDPNQNKIEHKIVIFFLPININLKRDILLRSHNI